MSDKTKIKRTPFKNPIAWAIFATVLVAAFGFWAGSQQVCSLDFWGNRSCSGTKWSAFLEASPNEVGDTLAGFAGALAFVWLIATVVLQGQELREQRQEFEKMADAQEEQAKILKAEQQYRNQADAQLEVEQLLSMMAMELVELRRLMPSLSDVINEHDFEADLRSIREELLEKTMPKAVEWLDVVEMPNVKLQRSDVKFQLEKVSDLAHRVERVQPKLSIGNQLWLQNIRFFEVQDLLIELIGEEPK